MHVHVHVHHRWKQSASRRTGRRHIDAWHKVDAWHQPCMCVARKNSRNETVALRFMGWASGARIRRHSGAIHPHAVAHVSLVNHT